MGLLDRYVGREVLSAVLFGVGVFTTLLVANHFFFVTRSAVQYGFSLGAFAQLVAYRIPALTGFALPMAMLFGTVLGYSRLAEGREIEAMQTGGIPPERILLPGLVVAALVSAASYGLGEGVVPWAELQYRRAWGRAVGSPLIPEVRWNVLFRDRTQDGSEVVVSAHKLDLSSGVLERVTVQQHRDGRLVRVVEAERATWGPEGWTFHRGRMVVLEDDGVLLSGFEALRLRLARSPQEVAPPERTVLEMSIREIRQELRRLRREGQPTRPLEADLAGKYALVGAPFAFALLGFPLGLVYPRGGRGIAFGLVVLVLIGYYLLTTASTLLAQAGYLPPTIAAWLPNLMTAGGGAVLLWRRR
ncbi:MAG: LptF/LptG family permease [Armatimonadota bacterium]|nr:LptF/LptG family permease [Armatimonadota bacterium]MDR7440074.1 LptF/LptG family permease [Armatimonadota bacterium]MDR7567594.1 LptF/LptG family permease [Armatimonadota bacterium]MDR7602981.1 LptF/LptG family permease [Armatimonadota bacterium]